jgi:hypothetical protein
MHRFQATCNIITPGTRNLVAGNVVALSGFGGAEEFAKRGVNGRGFLGGDRVPSAWNYEQCRGWDDTLQK